MAYFNLIYDLGRTSLRLRNLRDKVQSDQRDADDLRKQLSEVVEKETVLKDETEKLMGKANTLHNIVVNLERSLERAEQA
jgi:predicted  nucleic acid-binding Zn-ribbon protein